MLFEVAPQFLLILVVLERYLKRNGVVFAHGGHDRPQFVPVLPVGVLLGLVYELYLQNFEVLKDLLHLLVVLIELQNIEEALLDLHVWYQRGDLHLLLQALEEGVLDLQVEQVLLLDLQHLDEVEVYFLREENLVEQVVYLGDVVAGVQLDVNVHPLSRLHGLLVAQIVANEVRSAVVAVDRNFPVNAMLVVVDELFYLVGLAHSGH